MATPTQGRKVVQTWSFRGSKSRNKVSVGEPAEGSLQSSLTLTGRICPPSVYLYTLLLWQAASCTGSGWCVPARGPQTLVMLVSSEYYIIVKTFNNGSLGSGIDEERSEMR